MGSFEKQWVTPLARSRKNKRANRREAAIMKLWSAFNLIDDAASREIVRLALLRLVEQAKG